MRKLYILSILIFAGLLTFAQTSEFEAFLKSQPQIKSVEKIEGNKFFESTYKIMVEQPIDHSDSTLGYFKQRVFIADKGKKTLHC